MSMVSVLSLSLISSCPCDITYYRVRRSCVGAQQYVAFPSNDITDINLLKSIDSSKMW